MTDKVQRIREKIKVVINRRLNLLNGDYFELNKETDGFTNEIIDIVDSLQEEPVSEFLNTESMIESYKQRLISQANGVKNSPLIDMCLASYKHGINETLDTLKLSNVQRTVKNWKEHVSKGLEEAAIDYCGGNKGSDARVRTGFIMGAKWQKSNLWKPADGDDLPIIDREVIVLLNNGSVAFGHRPPEYWDGKDIITGKVTRNYVERYDKGLWNIPNVKYWLDVELPKEIKL
jgi:hypothetical protein